MAQVFLSDILKSSGPIDFEYIARGAPQQATSKAGKPYQFWEYTVRSRSTGQQSVERLFEFDHKKFAGIVGGQLMRASINAKGFVQWDPAPTGEAALQQPHSNTREVQGERRYTEAVQNRDEAKELKDISITLQAFTKSWIESGAAKTPEDACRLAAETYKIHMRDAHSIKLGIPAVAAHSPAQIQQANSTFGQDQTPDLDMVERND